MADHVEFYWDPMCPFAWVTSRWIVKVAAQVDLAVDWRFISLRMLNEGKNYETDFPPGYPMLHQRGLRMLRVAAAVRASEGPASMGALYTAFGESIWNRTPPTDGTDRMEGISDAPHLQAVLARVGLDAGYAAAADTDAFDETLRASTESALGRAGRDVGTPIIAVNPPDGPAFFGPVISRIPDDAEAVELWNAVMTLAKWPSFAELKRSLRSNLELPLFADQ